MLHTLTRVDQLWLHLLRKCPFTATYGVPAMQRLHPRHHDGAARLYGFDHIRDVEQVLALCPVGDMQDVEMACRQMHQGSGHILVHRRPQHLGSQRLKQNVLTNKENSKIGC